MKNAMLNVKKPSTMKITIKLMPQLSKWLYSDWRKVLHAYKKASKPNCPKYKNLWVYVSSISRIMNLLWK